VLWNRPNKWVLTRFYTCHCTILRIFHPIHQYNTGLDIDLQIGDSITDLVTGSFFLVFFARIGGVSLHFVSGRKKRKKKGEPKKVSTHWTCKTHLLVSSGTFFLATNCWPPTLLWWHLLSNSFWDSLNLVLCTSLSLSLSLSLYTFCIV